MKKNILVTGAGGFVGKNLAEYLKKDPESEVFSPLSKELNLLDETAVKNFFLSHEIDAVIHCANRGGTRKTGYDEGKHDVVSDNLRMFFNLVRVLPKKARMLHLGTGAEYDRRNYAPKMEEDRFDMFVPADAYGYSKYIISKYIEKTGNITCLRIFGLFGKYEDYTFKFISNAIVKNLLGLPIVIKQNVVFDYLCVEDFCAMTVEMLKVNPSHAHYNITPTESIDLVTLAKLINATSEKPSEIKVLTPGLNMEYTGSNKRILAELGGFNFTPYVQSVKPLYAYYAARLNELDLEAVKKDPFLKTCKTSDGAAERP